MPYNLHSPDGLQGIYRHYRDVSTSEAGIICKLIEELEALHAKRRRYKKSLTKIASHEVETVRVDSDNSSPAYTYRYVSSTDGFGLGPMTYGSSFNTTEVENWAVKLRAYDRLKEIAQKTLDGSEEEDE